MTLNGHCLSQGKSRSRRGTKFLHTQQESGKLSTDTYLYPASYPSGCPASYPSTYLSIYTGASLRIRFHLTHRASDFIKSLARMKFHSPGKYFVKTYIHLILLFNTNILYSLLLINMKCFLILLNIYDLQIFFCFFYLSLYY